MIKHILFSCLIWLSTYLLLIPVSAVTVPVMLHFGWPGFTTWFGNYIYGRAGNKAFQTNGIFWREWLFLVVRNPISNFGKEVISYTVREPVKIDGNPAITDGHPGITGWYMARSGWAWEVRMVYKTFPGRCFEGRWGWKLAGKQIGDECTFVCRANPFRTLG